MTKIVEGAADWRPEWTGEQRRKFDELLASQNANMSTMRAIRTGLGLTQVDVARILDMTQANISKLETSGDPSLTVLKKIAEAKGMRLQLALVPADESETLMVAV